MYIDERSCLNVVTSLNLSFGYINFPILLGVEGLFICRLILSVFPRACMAVRFYQPSKHYILTAY